MNKALQNVDFVAKKRRSTFKLCQRFDITHLYLTEKKAWLKTLILLVGKTFSLTESIDI